MTLDALGLGEEGLGALEGSSVEEGVGHAEVGLDDQGQAGRWHSRMDWVAIVLSEDRIVLYGRACDSGNMSMVGSWQGLDWDRLTVVAMVMDGLLLPWNSPCWLGQKFLAVEPSIARGFL